MIFIARDLRVGFFFDAGDDKLDFGFAERLAFIEGGSGGAFDFVLRHTGHGHAVFFDAVLDKEVFDRLGAFQRELHIAFEVDTIGLDVAFDLKGDVGVVAEHEVAGAEIHRRCRRNRRR